MRAMKMLLCLCVLVPALAFADESAADISKKSRERGALNLVGLTAKLKLATTAKDGKVKEQVLQSSSKKIGGKSHALSKFLEPSSVAGVAVLTIEGAAGQGDDISLYLPRLKQVRKVAKQDRGQAFMNTDFSYADIASNGGKDEDFKRLKDEAVQGRDCYVLKGEGGAESPYGEVSIWVDKQTFVPMKVDYADKQGKPLKRYTTLKLKAFKDRTIAAESTMENLQTGSKTQMTVLSLDDSTLGDDAFSERALERG